LNLLQPVPSTHYRKDFKKIVQSPKLNQAEYLTVITLLLNRQTLPPKYVNHELKGAYSGFWDCHITNDCVLIYKVSDGELRLARIGIHSEVFNK
jgi:mRNA interferase YafQ